MLSIINRQLTNINSSMRKTRIFLECHAYMSVSKAFVVHIFCLIFILSVAADKNLQIADKN